jgi:hypothetical protein
METVTESALERVKRFKVLHDELYEENWIIGVMTDHVQVEPKAFKNLVPDGTIITCERINSERIDLKAVVDGIVFLTLI